MDRYFRNIGAISAEEQQMLRQCSVCIAGLGGLGGYVLEFLARLGIGSVTGIDFDRFDITNQNRQLLSETGNIGVEKAAAAAERVKRINGDIRFTARTEKLTAENAEELLAGHDLVIDALDGVETRLMLSAACAALNIPLVHGAVDGWLGQAAVIYPGSDTMKKIYSSGPPHSRPPSVLAFAPAATAAFQVSLAVRVLLGKAPPAPDILYLLDLLTFEFNKLNL